MASFASRFGVYIHFPYCLSKCPYCDFASVVEAKIPQRAYTDAIVAELTLRAREHERPASGAESLYFGGGTPSLWEPAHVAEVIEAVDARFGLAPGCEITLEANPGASEADRFAALREAGVNRLSIGVQSFDAATLAALGRGHTSAEAARALEKARTAGFSNVSLDLIFGAPGQTLELARADVAAAIALRPSHLSCYGLTLEGLAEDVRLAKDVRRGRVTVPDDEAQAQMGAAVRAELAAAGFSRYEISNYALFGCESRHNSLYWLGREYVAAGCGAHGFRRLPDGRGYRYGNPRKPDRYLAAIARGTPPEEEREQLEVRALFEERLFLGLRFAEGFDLADAARETIGEIPEQTLEQLEALVTGGLVVREGTRLRCTPRGLDFHTEVAVRLLPDEPSSTALPLL